MINCSLESSDAAAGGARRGVAPRHLKWRSSLIRLRNKQVDNNNAHRLKNRPVQKGGGKQARWLINASFKIHDAKFNAAIRGRCQERL